MKNKLLILALTLVGVSCSTTRRIPDDDLLYTGVKRIEYTAPDSVRLSADMKDDIAEAVNVAPNNYWKLLKWRYPFPLGLWVYNNWPNPEKGFRHWLYESWSMSPSLLATCAPRCVPT